MTQTDEDDVLSPIYDVEQRLTVREKVLDLLLAKVEQDKYPSPTMLDDIERILTPWRRQDYADILLAKIEEDRYPSRGLIQRLLKLCS